MCTCRYIDQDRYIREDLVDFIEYDTDVTGPALAGKMLQQLHTYGFDVKADLWS